MNASGVAWFKGAVDLQTAKVVEIQGLPADGVVFGSLEQWLDVDVGQVNARTGEWRLRP